MLAERNYDHSRAALIYSTRFSNFCRVKQVAIVLPSFSPSLAPRNTNNLFAFATEALTPTARAPLANVAMKPCGFEFGFGRLRAAGREGGMFPTRRSRPIVTSFRSKPLSSRSPGGPDFLATDGKAKYERADYLWVQSSA